MSTLRQRPRRAPAKSDPTPQGLPKLDSRWQLAKPEFDGEWVPISQVYDLQMGKTPSRDVPEYWNNGDHNWVSIKDLGSYGKYVGKTSETISERGRKESGIKAVPADTLLMSFKLSLGKASITAEETFTNEAIMAFLDKGAYEVDIDYMWYQLRSKDWSAGTNTAVMGKTLNKKTLGSTLIRVPPIAKQREVARRLDSAENVLSLLGREKNTLDDLVKSQFVEMFGDPIEVIDGIALGSIALLKAGETTTSSSISNEIHDGLYPCYGGNGLRGFTAEYTHDGSYPLIGRQGALCGNVRMAVGKFKATEHAVVVQPSIEINRVWLFHYLRYDNLARLATGAAQPGLSVKNLNKVPVALPPLDLQRRFANFVAQVDKLGFDVQQQIEKLETLKQSLMQEYFG